jgi:tight adherence protein C
MPVLMFGVVAVAAAGLGLLILAVGARLLSPNEEERRLARYVAAPAEVLAAPTDPLAFRRSELQGTFRQRLLLPWFSTLGGVLNRMTPVRSIARLTRQLAIAAHPLGLGAREFYGLQLLFMVFGFWAAITVLRQGIVRPPPQIQTGSALVASQPAAALPTIDLVRVTMAFMAIYIGTQGPKVWLRGRVRARQKRLRRNLPDALDMLSVCAEAGLGFDQALQRVSESWKTPLAAEFGRVIQEMGMGLSRAQAMRNMADRLEVEELSSFTAVIVQSDEMGMSITDTLRSQAEQMRVERRHRAQEEARKAPLKMLFPIIFMILPALGAVVIGPTIPAFMDLFGALLQRTAQ